MLLFLCNEWYVYIYKLLYKYMSEDWTLDSNLQLLIVFT